MYKLIAAFFTSFLVTLLIIRFKHLHERLSADSDLSGPQKIHTIPVPRIGGISITAGLFVAIPLKIIQLSSISPEVILLVCAVPTFTIGLAEDLTKKISVRQRLFFTAISAFCVIYFLDIQVSSLGIPFVDFLFAIPFFSVVFTIIAITGLANAYNPTSGSKCINYGQDLNLMYASK